MAVQKNIRPDLNPLEERLVNAMQVLGDKTRFRMFKILVTGEEMCVSQIAEAVSISVPATSQHFRIFELNGLVDKHRYGQKVCYKLRLDDALVQKLITISQSRREA